MAPPPLFFQLGFYLGALAFAVAVALTKAAGGSIDAGVLRGVQALLSFLVLGWIAELVVDSAPMRPPAGRAERRAEPAFHDDDAGRVAAGTPATATPGPQHETPDEPAEEIDRLEAVAAMPIPLFADEQTADETNTLGGGAQAA